MKKINIIRTGIPKYEAVIKIEISKLYYVFCDCRDSSYVSDKNNRSWWSSRKIWNDRKTCTSDFNNTIDDTLKKLENNYLANIINGRRDKLKRMASKMDNDLLDIKLTDNIDNNFKKISTETINPGHRKFAIK